MGEANRRGCFEERKRQAIDAEKVRQAEAEVIRNDKEAAERVNGTSGKRSKHSLSLAVAAMLAISSINKL